MRFDPRSQREATGLWRRNLGPKDRFERKERSRRMAEFFEGVSSDSDADGYGFLRPFGTNRTGAGVLRFFKRKAG